MSNMLVCWKCRDRWDLFSCHLFALLSFDVDCVDQTPLVHTCLLGQELWWSERPDEVRTSASHIKVSCEGEGWRGERVLPKIVSLVEERVRCQIFPPFSLPKLNDFDFGVSAESFQCHFGLYLFSFCVCCEALQTHFQRMSALQKQMIHFKDVGDLSWKQFSLFFFS